MNTTQASYNRESTVYPLPEPPQPPELPEPFALRERTDADHGFVQALYVSGREDLRQAIADAALLQQLVAMQHNAQEMGYRQQYPLARQWLLLQSGHPIGRLVVDASPAQLHLVDIAVLPEARRSGAATAALRALQAQALAQGLPLGLSVRHANLAARRLYDKLGFTTTSQDDMLAHMVWNGNRT